MSAIATVRTHLPGRSRLCILLLAATAFQGCGDTVTERVRLEFSLKSSLLACGGGSASGQLGFYVSRLRAIDEYGAATPVRLNVTPTQSEVDGIALVSWSGNCAAPSKADADVDANPDRDAKPDAEASAPTSRFVTGRVASARYEAIEFELGVPFEHNHANPLTAPAPLNVPSMFWTWQSGYKFLRLDIGSDWSFHLGSTGCVSESAVRPPRVCEQPNLATIRLPAAAAFAGVVAVDLDTLLADVDIAAADNCVDAYGNLEICRRLLTRLGIDVDTGRCSDDCGRQALFRYDNAGS